MNSNSAVALLGPRLGQVSLGNLSVDLDSYEVRVGQQLVCVSAQQFNLLLLLMRAHDRIIPTEALCELLWNSTDEKLTKRLSVIIHRLRLQLKGSHPYQLRTRRGRGYGFVSSISRDSDEEGFS